MKYLLDTCIVSYLINGKFPNVENNFIKHINDDMAISAITYAELMYGINKKEVSANIKKAVTAFCSAVTILPFSQQCAATYGELRRNYEKKGMSLSAFDGLIASHALADKRVLITKDNAFFQIKELSVEDWS